MQQTGYPEIEHILLDSRKLLVAETSLFIPLVSERRNAHQYIDQRLAGFIEFGASPRASIAFSQAARAVALLNGEESK